MNEVKDIPYIAYESSQARMERVNKSIQDKMERVNKRLWIVILVLIVALVGTNVGWLIWENQWQYVDTTTVTQDVDSSDGGNAIINDGVHINGESKTDGITN